VLVRIWLVVLALLMLAAPAGDRVAEAADAVSYAGAGAADDDTATGVTVVTLDEPPLCVVHVPCAAETIRPTPALARVFRPPRPAFD
jgi:hypothetical protein